MAGDVEASNIRVAVRCRPFNARERAEGAVRNALSCNDSTVQVMESTRLPKEFHYDHVFGCGATQEVVFQAVGLHLLDNAMNAYNGCIFAYGQTGSGKSHSIMGDVEDEVEQGILPRACTRLFSMLEGRRQDKGFEATVLASYLEIYNEKIFDLLTGGNPGELQVRNHPELGPIVPHLTECPVESFEEAYELLDFGAKRRAVAATQMNATSSRSHAVFTLQVRMVLAKPGGHVESQAKIHFVDLAGSERQKKSGAAGERLKEGIGINLSLTTLGRVISELAKPGARSVPAFRDSKLTLLLKDALMGNSRTELLACVSPSSFNLEETVSTLEFATRCKLVKTSAMKNEQSKAKASVRGMWEVVKGRRARGVAGPLNGYSLLEREGHYLISTEQLPPIIQTMYLIHNKDREHSAAMSLLSNQKEEVRAREVAVLQAQMASERAASEATLDDTHRALEDKTGFRV
ncbi:unc-104 [Symbiodinium natans]|uniref:Kinesin-like protein n=1 Tax=Symbiodinium natans TaxID=878477 RepID=A0A812UI58_9DINO|nr:unc-104 [Symbiodinium natans]